MNQWNDERLERIIGVLLRTGVMLSAVIVFLGGTCYLVRHGSELPDYHVFHGAPPEYRSVRGIIQAMGPSNCRAIIQFGLLLLIATPIARVAFSLVGFAMEHDRRYVVITSIVLVVLVYS
ncbi:MAG TPA: DUF1634 domain-containing protein, partial [Bryobacteraceae bacterium]|nr:DUF1634 domain-containing protein [Bryobacteraceae bacterium]